MNPLEKVAVGTPGETVVTVSHDMTVQHFVSTMPAVFATTDTTKRPVPVVMRGHSRCARLWMP